MNSQQRRKKDLLCFPKSMKKLFPIIKHIRKKMTLIQESRDYFYMCKNIYILARQCNISNSLWKPNFHSVIMPLVS